MALHITTIRLFNREICWIIKHFEVVQNIYTFIKHAQLFILKLKLLAVCKLNEGNYWKKIWEVVLCIANWSAEKKLVQIYVENIIYNNLIVDHSLEVWNGLCYLQGMHCTLVTIYVWSCFWRQSSKVLILSFCFVLDLD